MNGLELAPSEAWGLTLEEYLVLIEHRRPAMKGDYAGGMTQGQVDELDAMLREAADGGTESQSPL